jgi:N-hydroxyarylamine O-acetyltransferase
LEVFSEAMNPTDFPLYEYLERVGLKGSPAPNEEGLKQVHIAQAFSIPFENLDIHLGRTISLKHDDLVAKLIRSPRGGYCFELNGILNLALKALGFEVRPILARVIYSRSDPGGRTHQVLMVTGSRSRWLADTGFGGPGLRLPIPMAMDRVEEQFGDRYRMRQDPAYGTVLQKESGDAFLDLYAFDEKETTTDIDIEIANHYTATFPDSIFKRQRMCSLSKPWGRITLADMELTIYRDGQSSRHILPPGPSYMDAVSQHFGINLNANYEDFIPLGHS